MIIFKQATITYYFSNSQTTPTRLSLSSWTLHLDGKAPLLYPIASRHLQVVLALPLYYQWIGVWAVVQVVAASDLSIERDDTPGLNYLQKSIREVPTGTHQFPEPAPAQSAAALVSIILALLMLVYSIPFQISFPFGALPPAWHVRRFCAY
jgi:hypothetical protein